MIADRSYVKLRLSNILSILNTIVSRIYCNLELKPVSISIDTTIVAYIPFRNLHWYSATTTIEPGQVDSGSANNTKDNSSFERIVGDNRLG